MDGPTLYLAPGKGWLNVLNVDKVQPWYCDIPGAEPSAFSGVDGTPGPDAGDRIITTEETHALALTYAAKVQQKRTPTSEERIAGMLEEHEFSHTVVPASDPGHVFRCLPDGPVVDWKAANQRYSHPSTPGKAIVHTFITGFQVNAFTRILRIYDTPLEVRTAYCAWALAVTPQPWAPPAKVA